MFYAIFITVADLEDIFALSTVRIFLHCTRDVMGMGYITTKYNW